MKTIAEIEVSYRPVPIEGTRLLSSRDTYIFCIQIWNMDIISLQEEMKLILLNRNNNVLGVYSLSRGGIMGTTVDNRLVLGVALKTAACAIILVHNHPSGNLKPSRNDREVTERIKEAAALMPACRRQGYSLTGSPDHY